MANIIEEFEALKKKNFELEFRYPTDKEREQLLIIHRDISSDVRVRIESRERGLAELFEDMESGKVHIEDIDPNLVARFRRLLLSQG